MEFTEEDSFLNNVIERNIDPITNNENENQFMDKLRVLVIDDNIVCLKVIKSSLEKCKYKVKATTKATEALEILRKKEEIYDIVITDVKMHEMDGFQLLEIIGLEMDIPVIMISASSDKELVMKGVRHGARDYLVKPVRMEELQNIWQHVVRKNMFEPSNSKSSITRVEVADNSMMNTISVSKFVVDGEPSLPKKPRVSWSTDLHQKFIDAIKMLEAREEEVLPKKILAIMEGSHLSRENVASHLQKYRKGLKKGLKKGKRVMTTTEHLITNVVNNINGPSPLQSFIPSNKNHFLVQQNQQLPQLPPTYGNYFHQTPVFSPNPPPPWNRSISFNATNNPNHSMDSKYAIYGNANPTSNNNNYGGIPQPYLSYPNNSFDIPNFQVTISQPAPINIHTNPIIMAQNSSGNMTANFDPSHADENSLLNVDQIEWIPSGQLLYQQQQTERQNNTSTDDDFSAIMKEFNNS